MNKSFLFGEAHGLISPEATACACIEFTKAKHSYSIINPAILLLLIASSAPALAGTCVQLDQIGNATANGSGASGTATCGSFSIAIGAGSGATASNFGIAIGDAARSTGNNSVGLGRQTTSDADSSTALGSQSQARSQGSTAVGQNAAVIAAATSGTALGQGASVGALNGTAIGSGSSVTGAGGVAIGRNATSSAAASGTDAVAIGGQSQANGSSGVAIGRLARTTGNYGLALGDNAVAAANSVAMGQSASATGVSSISIGTGNSVTGNNSGAIGDPSTVSGTNSYSLGNNNTIDADNAFAIGNNLNIGSGLNGAVVLGDGSTVQAAVANGSMAINGTTYNFAGEAPSAGSVLSIGAAGAERQITHVAAGQISTTSTDAVNGSQLFATNSAVNALGTEVSQNSSDITDINGRITNVQDQVSSGNLSARYFRTSSTGADSVASGADSVAIGQAATASEENSIALGNGASAGFASSLALGAGSVTTVGAQSGYSAYRLSAPQNSVGEVAVGTASGNRKVTGVAAGTSGNDAVNVAQLMAVGDQVDQNTTGMTNLNGRVTNVESLVSTGNLSVKYFRTNSVAADSIASGSDAIAVGPSADASGNNAIAIGNGAHAQADGSVALGANASDDSRGAESYTGKYSNASNNSVGTVSVGNAATGEIRTVSNVADGIKSNDAVNVRQLDGAVAESKQYTDSSIGSLGSSVGESGIRLTQIEQGRSGMFRVGDSTGASAAPSASGTNSIAAGAGAAAAAGNAVALGNNARAQHQNAVALGANSVTDRSNSVSVGSAGNERQITHVAAATRDTDAVNLSQLNRSMSDMGAASSVYTDRRFNQLKDDMNRQDRRLSAGIAGAMSMASLPQPYSQGASMMSIGGASYRGESGMSFGASHLSDNGRWVTKAQLNTNTQRNVGWGVGVGYQF